jgi:hypothetical protein
MYLTERQVAYLEAITARDLVSEAEAMRRIIDKEINNDPEWNKTKQEFYRRR